MSTVYMSFTVGQRTSYHLTALWLACLVKGPAFPRACQGWSAGVDDMALRQELQDHQAAI